MKCNSFKLVVLLLAPVAGFGLLEVGFRYHAYTKNQETLGAAFSVPPRESPNGRVRFCDIIQPHANDSIIYELRPNLRTTYKGQPLSTNSLGLRGAEVPLAAEPGTITLVAIGASNMFGHGVGDEDLYTVHLERLLRERYPTRGWRVINTAVPSYNVVMKVETLKLKGLQFDPDFVLLHFASNNLDLPNYIRVPTNPFEVGESFVVGFLRERCELAALDKSLLEFKKRGAWEQVPEQFRGLVGWPPFFAAADELAALAQQHGFGVLTFANLDVGINTRLIRQAGKRGMHSVCFMPHVVEYLDTHYGPGGFTDKRFIASDLVVGGGNNHPSARMHELIAGWLLRELEQRGVLACLMELPQ